MHSSVLQFRVARYPDLSAEEVSRWREYVAVTDPYESPLLQPEYVAALANVRSDVEIGIVERGGLAVGFLPFHRVKRRQASPIGASITDMHAILAAPGLEIDEARWLKAFGLNRFDFDHLIGPISSRHVFRYDTCYRMRLNGGFDGYRRDLDRQGSFRKQLERKYRKLCREHADVELVWQVDADEAVDRLIAWKSADLDAKGYASPFRHDWVVGLMARLLQSKSASMAGLLSGLRVGDEFAALHFGVVGKRSLLSWLPSFNPAFDRYSPGGLLLYLMAESAAANGIELIDLGRGENATKLSLSNDTIAMAIGSIDTRPLPRMTHRAVAQLRRQLGPIKRRLLNRIKG